MRTLRRQPYCQLRACADAHCDPTVYCSDAMEGRHPSLNIPHAFVPHPDTMSPTGAPWAAPQPSLGLKKAPAEIIQASSAMPATIDPVGRTWQPARKQITSAEDLERFLHGSSAREFVSFILAVCEACTGKKLSQLSQNPSPLVQGMASMLDQLQAWVAEIPPVQQSLRYGNPAFKTWHARLVERAEELLKGVMPAHMHGAAKELVPYLTEAFGNATRIDFGTGHETTFVALLFCLSRLGLVAQSDCGALVGVVFAKYLDLMRCLQTTYWLEPAGSHGVWGLDDYHFMPFIWGAAQLVNHPMIRPKSVLNQDTLDAYANEYLYLGAVRFVKRVKKGPLQETSPMLCDIAAVPVWTKVVTGLVKMYQVEVLSKFPIMQHFLFSSLLPLDAPTPTPTPASEPELPALSALSAQAQEPSGQDPTAPAPPTPAAVVGSGAAEGGAAVPAAPESTEPAAAPEGR